MNTDFDVAIIGGGIIGASIFYHLSREHYRVALIEKNKIASGCTKASGGIIRSFHMDHDWADHGLYGCQYYREFENHTGIDCEIHTCGFLYLPVNENILRAKKQVERLSRYISMQYLDHSDMEQQFSYLFTEMPRSAVFEPQAMYVSPVDVANAWVDAGVYCGGRLYENTHVSAVTLHSSAVLTETQQGCISAKQIVIAAGSNTPAILDHLGFQHQFYVKHIRADIRTSTQCLSTHPAFIDESMDLYGRPDFSSESMYIGLPTIKNNTSENHTSAIYRHGTRRFKWMEKSHLLDSVYSDDCYSLDGRASIKAINKENTVFIASACNGGGVKLAPWAGAEILRLIKHSRGES